MDLVLSRQNYTVNGIFGELRDVEGVLWAITLEHAYTDGEGGYYPKTPPGTYDCHRGVHRLEHGGPFTTFELMDVPGHEGILFHIGNYNKDSDGCILLGRSTAMNGQGEMITDSEVTFNAFMAKQSPLDAFVLLVLA